ncbi:MAG TPA: hypothetical protein VMH78_03340 [Thermoplasmata archaeon]|nr:hypothetical protein [Thermoplasmata archaeon]
MGHEKVDRLERSLLLHLLDHRGQQVRFEADQWTTEFGILRRFATEDATAVKQALRVLEMSRWIYRRVQYVIGYSEPKLVYSLTPSGHRKAVDLRRDEHGGGTADEPLFRSFGSDEPLPAESNAPAPRSDG